LKNIDFWGPKRQTLLPVSVVGCIQEFTHGDRQTKLTEDDEIVFAHWRKGTAHLLPKPPNPHHPDARKAKDRIGRLVRAIDDALVTFWDPKSDNTERLMDLRTIVSEAAKLGMMIFASPSRWEFDWRPSSKDLPRVDKSRPAQKFRAYDSDGKSVVIVRFPTLIQRVPPNPIDPSSYRGRRFPTSEYDYRQEIFDILRAIRSTPPPETPTLRTNEIEERHISPSESYVSSSSPSKPLQRAESPDD